MNSQKINEFIIETVNKLYNTTYKQVNDEVFDKFFNSKIIDNDFELTIKLSYEANIYLMKNRVDKIINNIIKKIIEESDYNRYNMTMYNFNYIINKIVEWTISNNSFKDFVENIKNDKRFNNNLLYFVILTLGYSLYHKRYILYVIYKYAELMNYETIVYLFDVNVMWNYSSFDNYYKRLINKRFNEKIFNIVFEDNYNDNIIDTELIYKVDENYYHVNKYKIHDITFTKSNYLLRDILTHLQYNDIDNTYLNQYFILCHKDTYLYKNDGYIILNPYITLLNYLILSNRMKDLKTMLLTINLKNLEINIASTIERNLYYLFYFSMQVYNSVTTKERYNIYNKKFITLEVYKLLEYLNVSSESMQNILNLYHNTNIYIHDHYYDNVINEKDIITMKDFTGRYPRQIYKYNKEEDKENIREINYKQFELFTKIIILISKTKNI